MSERPLDAEAEPAAYEEARGPRLPDFVMALSTTAWVFSLLAIARLIWFVRQWDQPPSATSGLSFIAAVIPAVGAVLLPAALAIRHPDAPVKAPWLFLGTVLLAAVEGMRVLGPSLQPLFEQIAPAAEETQFLVPLTVLYTAVAGLLGAVAIAAIARGLVLARRYADRSSARPVIALVASVAVLIAVVRLTALTQLRWDQLPMTPVVIVYAGSTALLSVLSVAAWAYVAATSIAGARAGEEPELGWLFAGAGAALVLGAFAANAMLNLGTVGVETEAFWTNVGLIISLGYALGYLGIVAGFLVGLPSFEPVPDFADEELAGVDEGPDAQGAAMSDETTADTDSS